MADVSEQMTPTGGNLREGIVAASFFGVWVVYAHTFFAYSAFVASLATGIALHYKKIVATEYYEFPQEWFPSASATTGNYYPERNIFHILIAICSGPRFALILLWYLLACRRKARISRAIATLGLLRTFLFGAWAYVSSTEGPIFHEITGIGYILLTLPWTLCIISMSSINPRALKYRKVIAGCLFGTLIPMVLFFILHKRKVPGTYSIFALFEWTLVFSDIAFDAVSIFDLRQFQFQVVEEAKDEEDNNIIDEPGPTIP